MSEILAAEAELKRLIEYWQSKDWSDPELKFEKDAVIYAFQTVQTTCKNVIWRFKEQK